MGRKAVFSDEQIINAGKVIKAEGKPVSPFAIRNMLNGGSTDRIKDVWHQYTKKLTAEEIDSSSAEEIELPTEIQETLDKNSKFALNHLEKLANESYRIAQQVAEKRVKSTIKDYQIMVDELEESERQANLAIDASDRKAESLEDELESITAKNETLHAKNSRLSGIIDMLKERVLQLETTEVAFTDLQREFGKLEGQIELLRNS